MNDMFEGSVVGCAVQPMQQQQQNFCAMPSSASTCMYSIGGVRLFVVEVCFTVIDFTVSLSQ